MRTYFIQTKTLSTIFQFDISTQAFVISAHAVTTYSKNTHQTNRSSSPQLFRRNKYEAKGGVGAGNMKREHTRTDRVNLTDDARTEDRSNNRR